MNRITSLNENPTNAGPAESPNGKPRSARAGSRPVRQARAKATRRPRKPARAVSRPSSTVPAVEPLRIALAALEASHRYLAEMEALEGTGVVSAEAAAAEVDECEGEVLARIAESGIELGCLGPAAVLGDTVYVDISDMDVEGYEPGSRYVTIPFADLRALLGQ